MNYAFTDPKFLWLLAGLMLLAAKFVIPGVTLSFLGIGALFTAGCLYVLPFGLSFQVSIFLLSSIAGLLLFRSQAKAKRSCTMTRFYNSHGPLQPPETIGLETDVVEAILPPRPGRVLLHGALWLASGSRAIQKGERVKILSQDGLTVIVNPVRQSIFSFSKCKCSDGGH